MTTPSICHYATLIMSNSPYSLQKWFVGQVFGRDRDRVFSAYYEANARREICFPANKAGLQIHTWEMLEGSLPTQFLPDPLLVRHCL